MNPSDLRFSEEHEWVRVESDGSAVVGITEFASESLGDIVYVELPEVGAELSQFEKMGEIESVKAVSDLNSPVGGRVLERNDKLTDNPENVNEEPYESGWMLKVALGDTEDLDKLMTAEQYKAFLASQE
ncbi:MAG: glycine cleavage system protein GcvH [SAR202 cluster bacterium]|jgi:glycine cleavage system H protein|nr:glycine cleavage system protein GcvH [SAR202 cluster bacterium]